tara:strand:- start:12759 stop:12959 length:201 start_codon:yes stop_codon:yes gene_type:complete
MNALLDELSSQMDKLHLSHTTDFSTVPSFNNYNYPLNKNLSPISFGITTAACDCMTLGLPVIKGKQ